MTKTMLLAAACVFAGWSAHAVGAPSVSQVAVTRALTAPNGGKVIIDQTSGSTGIGLISQNFGSAYKMDDQIAADAFTIKKGAKITTVLANGQYFNGSGPATAEEVTAYNNGEGAPGLAIKSCSYTNVSATDNDGTFTITLPKACKLKKGTYWVSVVANLTAWGDRSQGCSSFL